MFVSATIRTEPCPSLPPRSLNLGLDFVFAHGRNVECGKLCHGFAEALGSRIASFFIPTAQEIDEVLYLGPALWGQTFQLLDQRLRVARVHMCP